MIFGSKLYIVVGSSRMHSALRGCGDFEGNGETDIDKSLVAELLGNVAEDF